MKTLHNKTCNNKLLLDDLAFERRKAQRLNIPIKVRYRLKPSEKTIETVCSNISGTGICLEIDRPIRRGDRPVLNLYLPGCKGGFIRAHCEVAWCKRARAGNNGHDFIAGIRYIKMRKKDRERFVLLYCEMMIDCCV